MSDDFRDDLGSSDQEQSNQPTPAPLGVLQRTANAISPWVRRWWMGGASTARVPGQFPLASRVQRSVEFAAHPGGGGELIDRFSSDIVQRHATADQISRRYRIETRQPTSPAPSQLPLPGVTGASRVQRSPAEMSLEQLAHSFQTAPSVAGMDDQPIVQRAFDPALGSDTPQPSNLAELQDAARQAAQMRAAASVEGGAKTVQRTSESGTPSIAAMIGERIRQARERQAAQGMTSGTPPSAVPGITPGAPSTPPIQRSPAAPMSTAAGSGLPDTGNRIAAAIEARIRQARERLAAGNAPGRSAENSAESSAPSVSPASATPSLSASPLLRA